MRGHCDDPGRGDSSRAVARHGGFNFETILMLTLLALQQGIHFLGGLPAFMETDVGLTTLDTTCSSQPYGQDGNDDSHPHSWSLTSHLQLISMFIGKMAE